MAREDGPMGLAARTRPMHAHRQRTHPDNARTQTTHALSCRRTYCSRCCRPWATPTQLPTNATMFVVLAGVVVADQKSRGAAVRPGHCCAVQKRTPPCCCALADVALCRRARCCHDETARAHSAEHHPEQKYIEAPRLWIVFATIRESHTIRFSNKLSAYSMQQQCRMSYYIRLSKKPSTSVSLCNSKLPSLTRTSTFIYTYMFKTPTSIREVVNSEKICSGQNAKGNRKHKWPMVVDE